MKSPDIRSDGAPWDFVDSHRVATGFMLHGVRTPLEYKLREGDVFLPGLRQQRLLRLRQHSFACVGRILTENEEIK